MSKRKHKLRGSKKYPPNENVPYIPMKGEIIPAKVINVYDGDTLTVLYKYKKVYLKVKIRILGIDTPEKIVRKSKDEKKTKRDLLEEQAGSKVANLVKRMLDGKEIYIRIDKFDKYGGRVNAIVYIQQGGSKKDNWTTLHEYLIMKKYAMAYNGGKKEKWTTKQLKYILEK